jgi:hypothetical protein
MYEFHEHHMGRVCATPEQLFDYLDDQAKLSAHMNKRSWRMGWGKFQVATDQSRGRAVGSHIVLDGRVLGIRFHLNEVVTERVPPLHKRWETVGEPRLLVIGGYRMGFEVTPAGTDSGIRVAIEYDLPGRGPSRLLGKLFGRAYARWCTRRMVLDAQAAFPPPLTVGKSPTKE